MAMFLRRLAACFVQPVKTVRCARLKIDESSIKLRPLSTRNVPAGISAHAFELLLIPEQFSKAPYLPLPGVASCKLQAFSLSSVKWMHPTATALAL